MTAAEAYEAGRKARREGLRLLDNPHSPDDPSSAVRLWAVRWKEGWCDADAMIRSLAPYQA